ncbi:ABC transporter ATP-binding protein [uncultured Clostridium sp.]|uniref:ABC transporter ATP-binding protein n=1 Tax=uncultured Clostridium sp. TaxID=59620 RepID=UPI0025CFEDCA|nr:ABC transporter ATP-binding protein [uncultured Clostridium sp.]
MEIIKIRDFSFTYPMSTKKALNNINIDIEEGDFILLCGKTGCGKSTLLRHLKNSLVPHGEKEGIITYKGVEIDKLDRRVDASEIGYVLQSPDNQIVTDKVWHELAFGMESLGYDSDTIRVRVAEMASYFGIENWFYKKTTELSGGEKQILNLAAIMTMNPKVLILDEPTSQLDPIAAMEFLQTVKKINLDLGITVILSEHRLEEVFTMADRVIVMSLGKVLANTEPRKIAQEISSSRDDIMTMLPTTVKLFMKVKGDSDDVSKCPISIRDGRRWLGNYCRFLNIDNRISNTFSKEDSKEKDILLKLDNVWFKYEKDGKDIIKNLSLNIEEGEIFSIVGGNGTGKSTTISIMAGINRPYKGKILYKNKKIESYKSKELFYKNIAVLSQNPDSIFVKKTVKLDLFEVLDGVKISKEEKKKNVDKIVRLLEIENILDMHPYDVSGGEKQKAALGKILLLEPKLLILDEPTKGIDNFYKGKIIKILKDLKEKGTTIVIVTHDVEFAAEVSTRCGMFFDGNVISMGEPIKFFSENNFYTTSANKISRDILGNIVTYKDILNSIISKNI